MGSQQTTVLESGIRLKTPYHKNVTCYEMGQNETRTTGMAIQEL
jgi:hypothetical protein